jgi:transcriptional regulator with XRE-family HTH domain
MRTQVEIFGATVEQFLRDRGRSKRWLADQIGVSPAYLSRLLSGHRPIRADLFFMIAAKLAVDPAAIGKVEMAAA